MTLLARYDECASPRTPSGGRRPASSPVPGTCGQPGFEQYSYDVTQVLGDLRGEVEELAEVSPDVVRVRARMQGRRQRSAAVTRGRDHDHGRALSRREA